MVHFEKILFDGFSIFFYELYIWSLDFLIWPWWDIFPEPKESHYIDNLQSSLPTKMCPLPTHLPVPTLQRFSPPVGRDLSLARYLKLLYHLFFTAA